MLNWKAEKVDKREIKKEERKAELKGNENLVKK